jgi:hypothetical protein
LRLLCGAWGIAAGLMLLPLTVAESTWPPMTWRLNVAELAFLGIALAGLALTVLHKERK